MWNWGKAGEVPRAQNQPESQEKLPRPIAGCQNPKPLFCHPYFGNPQDFGEGSQSGIGWGVNWGFAAQAGREGCVWGVLSGMRVMMGRKMG